MGCTKTRAVGSAHGRALIAAVIAFLLAACACACALSAHSPLLAYAASDDATLTLEVKYGEDAQAKSIDGMSLSAYQVARIGAGGSYEGLEAYSSAAIDFMAEMTAAESTAAAAKLAPLANNVAASASGVTGSDGKLAFGKLDPGIYLVVQTASAGTATQYTTLAPFLINVPQFTNEGTVYDVVAKPKPTLAPKTPTNVKTGDAIGWPVIAGCMIVGLVAILVALFAARRIRN